MVVSAWCFVVRVELNPTTPYFQGPTNSTSDEKETEWNQQAADRYIHHYYYYYYYYYYHYYAYCFVVFYYLYFYYCYY